MAVSSCVLYDDQATHFDERAGIPIQVAEAVADAVVSITGLGEGDLLLDIGTGTGSLSLPLVRRTSRYIGFDRSPAMVEVFRELLSGVGFGDPVHVADGNERWPADDRSVAVIFCARALHHLDPAHVVAETRRVLRAPGGWLVAGRVRRPPDSPKSEMRRRMRQLLEAQGYRGRSGDAGAEAVFGALERLGGRRAEPRVASRWTTRHRPADSIAAWEGKSGLAGIDVPAEVKARVLAGLRGWAAERFGSIDAPLPQEEAFEIAAIQIPID
ncbi:class I SAM-dependent methyltransferase [Longimicrobium sp.]|uniref:class I SAM-dependent methyltransferase n=1 Tax=Longimicrobium sp. TaxID=2029185 RepID=UPI002BDE9665|nr:class I SAM-dependent methyltransferase [Longimicrobium sp.]HSU17670.1 class I SAM-dependent methyltransferase [Longimicrobium sp.]